MIEPIVAKVAAFGAGILAAILIATVVKEGLQYIKGSGSVSLWGILGKVIILVLMLGFIFMAANYSTTLKDTGEHISNLTMQTTENVINEVLD